MGRGRLEAFSDGVFAIIVTIMVLELKVPQSDQPSALLPILPVLLTYVLSFVYVAIYWTNHHHVFQATDRINGAILWANIHLLFWISLTPFVTGWMGQNHFAPAPTAAYGFVLLMSAIAYLVLQNTIIADQGKHSLLAQAIGRDFKGKTSIIFYAVSIPLAFYDHRLSQAIFVAVALWWLVPDLRIVRVLRTSHKKPKS